MITNGPDRSNGTTRHTTRAERAERAGEVLLEVDGLRTHFHTPRGVARAVDGVSLTVTRGRALGIVGESGSGKTVLTRSIMGLVGGSAARAGQHGGVVQDGSVRYAGQEILGLPSSSMRHLWGAELAMVFQDPMSSLNPLMKVGKQIVEPLRTHLQLRPGAARAAAIKLLKDVKIPDPERRLNQYPHELSGGMRQRVMIAIALACGPSVLFADEPTTALDVTVQSQILDLIDEQRRARDMAVVLVTHDLAVVAAHTDEIAVMYGGKIVERAPTRRLFTDMKMPYTKALIDSIPRLDQPSHTRLPTIAGRPPDLVDPPAGCRFAPRCPSARERCHQEEPPLTAAASPDHQFACWYPLGTPTLADRDVSAEVVR